jgi:outer membrane protein
MQCTKANDNETAKSTVINIEQPDSVAVCDIKIAYVDYDSLLASYNFAQDIQKEIIRKEMSINNTFEEERMRIQEEYITFENKIKNNVFATQEQAQTEYEKIRAKEQETMQHGQKMIAELEEYSNTRYAELRQRIDSYIQEYNSVTKYDFILTKVGSNMLYANKAWDITTQIVEGLNAQYNANK